MIIIVVVVPRAVAVAAPWIVIGVRIVVIRHGPSSRSNKNLVISNSLILLFLYILLYTSLWSQFFFMVLGVVLCCTISVEGDEKRSFVITVLTQVDFIPENFSNTNASTGIDKA